MVNWYYVQGSDRVGPVDEATLRDLYKKGTLNAESYVWRKGFANWERIKDVSELDLSKATVLPLKKQEPELFEETGIVQQESAPTSPEIIFNFDWNSTGEEEELFFIKIGRDRKKEVNDHLYGPYSLHELKEALDDKRINNHSLIYSPGMPGWVEIGQTPLDPKNLKINTSQLLDESPLLLVMENDPLPLIAMIKEAQEKSCTLLGAGAFKAGETLLASVYRGTDLAAKDLKLEITSYDSKAQIVQCKIAAMNDDARKAILNYAK